jgi:hypothetical protein
MKIKDYLGEAETAADKKNEKLEKKMAKGVAKLSGVTNASDTDPERERLQNEQLHPLVAEHFGIIDELSKKTLGSYVKKATGGLEGAANQAYEAGRRGTEGGKNFATAVKRVKGVDKAVNKLTKEETIAELKTSTLQSYADKAHQQAMDATYDAAHLNRTGEEKLKANAKALASKRAGGVQLAQSKIDRKDQMEEVYYETLDLFLEALMSPEVRDRIKAHELAGHKTSDHASRMKNGEMEYSFVVTQPSGKRSRHIYHGSKTKHETMSPAPKSKEAHEAGEDDDDK